MKKKVFKARRGFIVEEPEAKEVKKTTTKKTTKKEGK